MLRKSKYLWWNLKLSVGIIDTNGQQHKTCLNYINMIRMHSVLDRFTVFLGRCVSTITCLETVLEPSVFSLKLRQVFTSCWTWLEIRATTGKWRNSSWAPLQTTRLCLKGRWGAAKRETSVWTISPSLQDASSPRQCW